MLDIRLIREHTDVVKSGLARLGEPATLIDEILQMDADRRVLMQQAESLRSERNTVSKAIPRIQDATEKQQQIHRMRAVGDQISQLEQQLALLDEQFQKRLLEIPNLPHPDVPDGPDETANVITGQEGDIPEFSFTPKPHWELAEALGIIDFERGVKMSGSRFYVLKGAGAALQRALITFMLDLHTREHGYTEIYPPYMVRGECLVGTGNLPKFGDNLYRDAEEDLWWIPTAEVPVTNLYREEILEPDQVPMYFVAYTACFRREKMSAGRDVRGIKRGHQFDKVELVKYVHPETSDKELQRLLNDAAEVARRLKLPMRYIQMCTGDLSFTAAMKYDIELWAPGCNEWLEVSSCSNFRDFQARRANIRFRREPGARPEYVHTLNGSGLALPRVLIAVLENYQQPDGCVLIPEALRPYLHNAKRITPAGLD